MNISELSIRRPVLSTVLTIIILLFGFIGYSYLGVREFPSVDNPIISVTCSYPGANADVIENQITEPLEQNINGIPGIRSMSSVSSQGQSRITVEFELSVDLETAANDVRDKVSRAQRYLPRDCDPPTVTKADADATPILMVTIQSDKRSLLELSEIADLTVKEQLQTISDVSGVQIWGEKRYSMRLWLDPAKMAGYGITPADVKSALDRENVELPSGSIEGNTTELTIRTLGLMHTSQEFNDLVVREDADRIIRLSDVGRAELGPQDTRSYMKMNGIPMVGIVVIPQPGANHIEIADEVYRRMESMKKDLPEDVVTDYGFDNTRFIRASIDEVKQTVYEAFLLVIIIIFLFLRNWRVTLIPCIVIPVSLIGTFFLMYVAGFSINVLSMLAVVLSVGLVVDDAIVMTENIYIRIERGMSPKEAGIEGAKEIFFAVISTSITLIAVFFPIVFMEGMTGRLFREFSLVISGAVVISTFAALTITPMLATKLLVRQEKQSWFYNKTEPFFVWLNNFYSRTLAGFLRRRWIALPLVALMIGLIGWLWGSIPAEMAPLEGPFADYDQHPRIGGRDLRIPARLYRGHQPARRFARARSPCRDGARLQRPRQRADRPEGHRYPRTYADGDRRGGVGCRAHEDQGTRVRAAAEHLRRTARQHAGAVRAAGDQYRTAAGGAAGIHAESLRKPRIPDGRRGPEIQQARSPHRDQPRQGQPAGRQYAQYRADAPVRTQRPASGLLLHERQAV